jgi:peroxiredoxin
LADFARHQADLEQLGVQIVALSSDTETDARGILEELSLDFTVVWGLDPEAASAAIGCYTGIRQGRPHIQPASFLLKDDGTIAYAVYSSGKVGRFTAADAMTVAKGLSEDQSGQ